MGAAFDDGRLGAIVSRAKSGAAGAGGMTAAVTDNICTADMETTCCSKALSGFTSLFDATAVTRLRSAGFRIIGKANIDEFGAGAPVDISSFGPALNPYDMKTPANGAAAAVAAALCDAALCSDSGLTVMAGAAACGVTGYRPTYGLVSRHGLVAWASSADAVCAVARSARDCAAAADAIRGPDGLDVTVRECAQAPSSKLGTSPAGIRIGVISPETLAPGAAAAFAGMGCEMAAAESAMLPHAPAALEIIACAEGSSNLARFDGVRFGRRAAGCATFDDLVSRSRAQGFGESVKHKILLGTMFLTSEYYRDYYATAKKYAAALRAEFAGLFSGADLLLSGVSPVMCAGAALAGLPCVTSVCGYSGGMPYGFMLTARRWDDALALAAADAFERGFSRTEPGVRA